jgi:protein-S-isoprenylcysteine O-methyltransferase Ste14
MYLGVMVLLAGMPLVLGSWWTFLPVGVMAFAMVVRTAFEDRMLRRELPGYDDYARRTRYRLLPGLW